MTNKANQIKGRVYQVKKETAIARLIGQGMTEKEANAEFNGKVNYYMRGTMKTIVKEWRNEIPGMEWQLIRMTRIVDKNGILIDGYNEFIDTRI